MRVPASETKGAVSVEAMKEKKSLKPVRLGKKIPDGSTSFNRSLEMGGSGHLEKIVGWQVGIGYVTTSPGNMRSSINGSLQAKT